MIVLDMETLYYDKRVHPKERKYFKTLDELLVAKGLTAFVGRGYIPGWLGIKNITVSRER